MVAGMEEGEGQARRRRWPRVLAVLALLLALVFLGLWLARKPIAEREAGRVLARAGVPARYTIANLGLGRQRLTNVVIGDPARPDLVADWLETRTAWSIRGPVLVGVRGGRVRVRARWADGRLSLGSIDRLLPKGEAGKPFALPALALDMADLRARVETPWGVVGAKLAGSGRLDGGFAGRLAVASDRLAQGDCAAGQVAAVLRTRTEAGRVTLAGPVRAAAVRCAGATVAGWRSDVDARLTTGERLAWTMAGRIATGPAGYADARAAALGGRFDLAGSDRLAGAVELAADRLAWRDVTVRRATLDADLRQGQGGLGLLGRVALLDADARTLVPRLAVAPGTPVAPLLERLAAATRAAAARFSARATVTLDGIGGDLRARIGDGFAQAATGATARLTGGGLQWRASEITADATLALRGGGLPTLAGRVVQGGDRLRADFRIDPYQADGARLALSPVAVAADGGTWRVVTRADLSGPLADGRVERLTLPIDARWRGGALTLAGGCAPVGWASVAVAGLRLDPGALTLCPASGALVRYAGGRLDGGARIAAARLTGRLGATPLTLAAAGASVQLADRGFTLGGVEALLGAPERRTRLFAGALDGRIGARGLTGTFAEAGGQIAAVPLILGNAAGGWRLAGGALALDGALTVSDAAASPRFHPLTARAVTLDLKDGRIAAAGALHEPTTGAKVADVAIRHDLPTGDGRADLAVAGLTFDKALQPDRLTPLTYGVIADVRGTISGAARIGWSATGVTSTGTFSTASTDLAAAFGPVTGLAGEIRFTDLLQLESAPHQRVTVKSINPGVPVTDGVVTFQTLPGTRVRVEDGRWPFAGGTLTLDPTLLDFSGPAERRLTFHVAGAAADKFLQSFDFKNLNATGTFDGALPMVFDANGGRIENGRLQVREGGGTIAYVGDISRKNLGFWGNFAFDALKSLRYRSLGITVNGPLAGEMVTEVRFAGVGQGAGAKTNFILRRLQRLPIVFNIRIRAPFRGLLDATASFYDPKRLIKRNLPALIDRQNQETKRGVQPPASEAVP